MEDPLLSTSRFALNRIASPGLGLEPFLRLAKSVGIAKVELRNDLPGGRIHDELSPGEALAALERHGVQVITINALQHFNLAASLPELERELAALARTAREIRCPAIVLCPHNDPADRRGEADRYRETLAALRRFGPLLADAGLLAYLEPLGFAISSLSSLATAAALIEESGFAVYRTVFDTFHHYLGPDTRESLKGQPALARVGLVHISGVYQEVPGNRYLDEHRGLIRDGDRLESRAQLEFLLAEGYRGDVSFEPFSPEVQRLPPAELAEALRASLRALGAQT
jgi:2-keto-myo-inositol isomerase